MKKIVSILLIAAILISGCGQDISETGDISNSVEQANTQVDKEEQGISEDDKDLVISDIDDPKLLQDIEDSVYACIEKEYEGEDYLIENVEATFLSKEYLEETAYNSKANIWFGYTLSELKEQFGDEKYVFTLSDEGDTIVQKFEEYDDTYDKVIKNVAIGSGVILVCATVSVITGGVGLTPVSMIFAASAKTGATMSLTSGAIGAAIAGTITAVQTHDKDAALKAAALQGSEDFKWGAIIGAVVGGASEASRLRKASKAIESNGNSRSNVAENIPEWRKAEKRALERYGGTEQVSFLDGVEVPMGTPGATRPDVVRTVGDHIEAVEVKYYNLESKASLNTLYSELEREVRDRVLNMPQGSTQRVVLDVTGRNFKKATVDNVSKTIQSRLLNIYGSNIPVDIVGL